MCGCNKARAGQPVRTWEITYPEGHPRHPQGGVVRTTSQSAVAWAKAKKLEVAEVPPPSPAAA